MDWHKHFEKGVANLDEVQFLEQVGKTVSGKPISQEQLDRIVQSLIDHLELQAEDRVLDLCCGNGVITSRIGSLSKSVIGIDFSESLINIARKHNSGPNIEYICQSLLGSTGFLHSGVKKFTKIYMYEALQCFEESALTTLFSQIQKIANKDALVVIGSVPDAERIWDFYDTPDRKREYYERSAAGNEAIGTWWTKECIAECASSFKWIVEFRDQDPLLHTAHYRFDFRFRLSQ